MYPIQTLQSSLGKSHNSLNFAIVEGVFLFSAVLVAFLWYAISPESKNLWIFLPSVLLYLGIVYRKNVPVLVMIAFFSFYAFVPYYFFWKDIPISFWPDYQSKSLMNFLVILGALFFVSFRLFAGKLDDRSLSNKRFVGSQKDRRFFYFLVLVQIIILYFGIRGANILSSDGYRLHELDKSPLHEYFVMVLALTFLFLDDKKRIDLNVLRVMLALYCLKTLAYGGRIEVLQAALLYLYMSFSFFYKKKILLFQLSGLALLIFTIFGTIRSNPFVLVDILNGEAGVDRILRWSGSSERLQNQFGDVTQSSLRILGLLQDGYLDFEARLSSFIQVVGGIAMHPSLRGETYNLSAYMRSHAQSGGGGLVYAYAHAWIPYFGPIMFGALVGAAIRLLYYSSSMVLSVYSLLVVVTFPRWFAYYPVNLFKLCVIGALVVMVYLMTVEVSKRKSVST